MDQAIRITSLRPRGDRFRIDISVLDQPLTISAVLVHRHRLKAGIVITPPQLEQLLGEARYDECERAVARMLAYREHAAGEVRDKLRQKKFDRDLIDRVLVTYTRNGLIDDARFARGFVRQQFERKPAWKAYLMAKVMARKVDRSLAETVVTQFLNGLDETEVAVAALQRKWREYADKDVETIRQKAYTYLSRRGIGYAAAKAAFETVHRRTHEDSND